MLLRRGGNNMSFFINDHGTSAARPNINPHEVQVRHCRLSLKRSSKEVVSTASVLLGAAYYFAESAPDRAPMECRSKEIVSKLEMR